MVELQTYAYKPPTPQPPPKKSPPWALIGVGAGVVAVTFCCGVGILFAAAGWMMMPVAGGGAVAPEEVAAQEMAEIGVEPLTKRGELTAAPATWQVTLDEPWLAGEPVWNAKIPTGLSLRRVHPAARDLDEGGLIVSRYTEGPPATSAVEWLRLDVATGDAIGEPITLWPNVLPPESTMDTTVYAEFRSALTLDGKLLAVAHPIETSKVLVKSSDGETVWEGTPHGAAPIDFVGWSADGALLTIGQGKLIATKAPGGEKIYEVGTDYGAMARLTPRNRTLAVVSSKTIDLIDTTNGTLLGQLALPERLAGAVGFLAMSEEGQRVAVARPYVEAPFVAPAWDRPKDAPAVPTGVNAPNAGELAVWDLSTGAMTDHWVLPPEINTGGGLCWIDARRLLVGMNLVDLDYGIPVVQFVSGLPYAQTFQFGGKYVLTADGKPYWESGALGLVDVPEAGTKAALPAYPPETTGMMLPGTKLAIEVSTGDASRDAQAMEVLNKVFQLRGYDVQPDAPWKITVTAGVSESGSGMEVASSAPLTIGGKTIHTPLVSGEIKTIAPDGTVVNNLQTLMFFPKSRSRYFAGTADDTAYADQLYDFGFEDPYTAMAAESWEFWLEQLPTEEIPTTAVKTANGYEKLPLTRNSPQDPKVAGIERSSSLLDPELHYYRD